MKNVTVELDNIVGCINRVKDDIEQLEQDNKKLNEDLQALEKERGEAYKSFNTETHILIDRDDLDMLNLCLKEVKEYTGYAYDECQQAENQIEEVRGSCDSANDEAREAVKRLNEIITKGDDNE
tara:strand:+ start:125 stop:496 length:372 start_codon:yes stop_codon:yes gene_type:complete